MKSGLGDLYLIDEPEGEVGNGEGVVGTGIVVEVEDTLIAIDTGCDPRPQRIRKT